MKEMASGEVESVRVKQERGGLGAIAAEREREERRRRGERRSTRSRSRDRRRRSRYGTVPYLNTFPYSRKQGSGFGTFLQNPGLKIFQWIRF